MATFNTIADAPKPMTSLATRLKRANKVLYDISRKSHRVVPLNDLFGALTDNGLVALQEDGTPWEGLVTGREGRVMAPVQDMATGERISPWLAFTYYRMESGAFEVVAYLG